MPATSKKQRKLMAMGLHAPEKIKGKNRGVLKMSKKQLEEFATTSEKGLPTRKKPTPLLTKRNKRSSKTVKKPNKI